GRVRITGTSQGGGLGGGGGPTAQALIRSGSAITFTRTGNTLTNDSQRSGALANGAVSLDVNSPCGTDVYVAIAAQGGGATLSNVNIVADPLVNCMIPVADAGMGGGAGGGSGATGGGSGTTGGGTGMTEMIPGVGTGSTTVQPAAKTGCGCASIADVAAPLMALLAIAGMRRRRRN
ncbi:MAG: hypothetical protein ACO1OB_25210, partial [Archangium sp.]